MSRAIEANPAFAAIAGVTADTRWAHTSAASSGHTRACMMRSAVGASSMFIMKSGRSSGRSPPWLVARPQQIVWGGERAAAVTTSHVVTSHVAHVASGDMPFVELGTAGVRWAWAAQLACPDQQDSHRAFEKEQTPRAARQRGPRLSAFLILFNSFIRRFSQPHQGKLSLRARAGPPSPAQRQRAGEEAAASSSPTHPPNCQTRL
mmetsp:Transcript_10618/g.25418  ORF Transcript_10618/g.25418 Transcript_10618/m.25418 type:complete len:205 (-) Transcript_10618:293-907(-)